MHERVTTAGIALKDGKVLVAHRVKGGSLSEKWEFPGGKQRWGESDEMTLKREYMEELGVEIETGDLVTSFDFVNNETLYHLHAYEIRILSGSFTLSVHSEVRWVTPLELSLLPMGSSDDKIRASLASLLLNS